jgi:hypothetical protein
MCKPHGNDLDGHHYARKLMKAVLEFAYPEDEDKLQHALKGSEYYKALVSIENILAAPFTKAEAYSQIKKIINNTLEDV